MGRGNIHLACILVGTQLLGLTAPRAASLSSAASPSASLSATSSSLASYRSYATAQAEMLARMTRVLAREIKDGDVEAAQNAYTMAHRYLERIKPAAERLDRDLDTRMDARFETDRSNTPDGGVSGFHRIEHGLFASRSVEGLSVYADRLHEDALLLQKEIATQAMPSDLLLDGAVETLEVASDRALAGGSEPYARTDLWDIEANLDGAQEIAAAIGPQIDKRDPLQMARVSHAFTEANARLEQYKEGCGFKTFDALASSDKASLKESLIALAQDLAKLKAVSAID